MRQNGKKNNFCESRTTICTEEIFMQKKNFPGKISLCTKFALRLKKTFRITKNASHNIWNTVTPF